MSFAIVFRSYPDTDHLAPMAWKLLEEGEEVHAVIARGYEPDGDHRIAQLRRYPRYREHRILPRRGGRLADAVAFVRTTLPWALALVVRKRVRLVVVEWGYGLPPGYERPLSRAGVVAVLRSLGRSIARAARGDVHQTRSNFMLAARLLGRSVVCLPHGLSIKLDAVTATTDKGREYDWSDRNRFSAYVMNTAHHRQWAVDHANADPEVFQTWGSLRWAPAWFERNYTSAPPFSWPEEIGSGGVKVVLMTPKWINRVHADQAVSLVRRLQKLEFVSLAVKDHPRVEARAGSPLRADPEIDWSRIHDITDVDSVSIIRAADVIIDVGWVS